MRLRDFSFIKMLDYPFEPKQWFRAIQPTSKPMPNKHFNVVFKKLKADLERGEEIWPEFKHYYFTSEQKLQLKEMISTINKNIDYSSFMRFPLGIS